MIRRTRAGTRAASTPNGLAPPPIRIPEPLISKSGLTLTASRGVRPSRAPIASARSDLAFGLAIERDARLDRRLEIGVALAGAGEADRRRVGPGGDAKPNSPPEAMSRPSTCAATCLSSGA